jgi:outer membrane protein OmpA-like peptidoglycan-associated protein
MDRKRALALVLIAAAGSLGACASVVPASWRPAPSCDDITFPVYFQEKSDALTPPALQMLAMAADKAKACRVQGVEVVGLADQRDASPELSQLRAENVSRALMARGLAVPRTDALGVVSTRSRDGRTQPMERRTEVVIHLD